MLLLSMRISLCEPAANQYTCCYVQTNTCLTSKLSESLLS